MTEITNEIKCTDRQLAILGLALLELNATEKPVINRLKLLQVEHTELAGAALGKLWKLILEGSFNTMTFKMQVNRMWPTQTEIHDTLLKKAFRMTAYVTTEWGLNAIDVDFEVKSFHKFSQEFVLEYNKIGRLKIDDDEMHLRFRKECKGFMEKMNKIYTFKDKPNGLSNTDHLLIEDLLKEKE